MGSSEMAAQTTTAAQGTAQTMQQGMNGAANAVSSSSANHTLLTTILIILAVFVAVIVIENVVQYFLARGGKPWAGLILPAVHIVYAVVHSLIIILPNKANLSYTLRYALTNSTMRLLALIFLVGAIALELLCEYFLVRKCVKLENKLNPPAPEAAE